ncbi:MAG: 6-hydroxymethylpterin diphosphokinase MptE-like protein [Zestosphaera sp.]
MMDEVWWASLYDLIRRDFGFEVERDYEAAEILDMLLQKHRIPMEDVSRELRGLLRNSRVLVVGAGPNCVRAGETHVLYDVVVAADGALRCCRSVGVEPQVVVTDLDGVELSDLTSFNGFIIIHAHGDNVSRLISLVPLLDGKKMLGTSQVLLKTSNLSVGGGFTDGDRAVYLALKNEAREVGLTGFDFGESVGKFSKPYLNGVVPASPVKKRKFYWGGLLIELMGLSYGARIHEACSRVEDPIPTAPRFLQV